MTPADPSSILQRNLAALGRSNPETAGELQAAVPAELVWSEAKAGGWTASVNPGDRGASGGAGATSASAGVASGGGGVTLASRFDPMAEAAKLVGRVDLDRVAVAVVLGLGLGYHVAELVRAMGGASENGDGREGLIIVYEPDPAVARAVLEKIDHTRWLGRPNVMLMLGEVTRARLTARTEGCGGLLTQGTHLLPHPPTRSLHPEAFKRFSQAVTDTVAYCRTNVATALVNSARTCENLVGNLGPYAAGATTEPLLNAAKGYPAVCVSAGPSLVKNIDLLADPGVRKNVVVIAVQTALRPLLDRGIRPDFVTALDYSPISTRFYEDLPRLDDVTLVAEPKAHPSILDAFPGPVRVTHSRFNDRILGDPGVDPENLARPITPIKAGATVAHLSFYLAQHLGCDPIILIGQDLGFSDGLYYCPGTAVHKVWEPEIGPFNTLENMEWTRVVRMRGHLSRQTDVYGQPIFSDEQMLTYLKRFERDFAQAPQTVIDATEGGMPKDATQALPLAMALSTYATAPVPPLPHALSTPDPARLSRTRELLQRRREQVRRVRQASQQCTRLLKQMQKSRDDPPRIQRLFKKLTTHRERIHGELAEAFELVNEVNTIGAFRRHRHDRRIHRQQHDPKAKQAARIDRDLENLDWLMQACDETGRICERGLTRLDAQLKTHAPVAAA